MAATPIPTDRDNAEVRVGPKTVRLTNLRKPFWPALRLSKGDLLRYYASIAWVLLPHIRDRAMVMKRYPHGAAGPFFFMKRVPVPHPDWLRTCRIAHRSGNVIAFPVIDDLAALLWVVNLGCIDLNPWYSRCDDVDRPDYLHFDLDPVGNLPFARVLEAALLVRDGLARIGIASYAKVSGSRGLHVYVPIVRGPKQKEVWTFAKAFAFELAHHHPDTLTAEYRIAKRPAGRVLVDYNQNAWGRTLASVYSARPTASATVAAPVTWREVEQGFKMEEFTVRTAPARIKRRGDLFAPLVPGRNMRARFKLSA